MKTYHSKPVMPITENQKRINKHKKAATHFQAAAKSHLEAANHHENESHAEALKSTISAWTYSSLAHEAQKEDVDRHINDEE